MKIAVAGAGYVGLSNAILLAKNNMVVLMDPDENKVVQINKGISPIADTDIEEYMINKSSNLIATSKEEEAYGNAEYVFIATPTNYSETKHGFDTSIVEEVIRRIKDISPRTHIVIKSTVPIGFTKRISMELGCKDIFFSPEFLREGHSLHDCLFPTRIVIGTATNDTKNRECAQHIINLLCEGAMEKDIPTIITGTSEAEAIKLFSNTFLAMRVCYFNELDTYAEMNGLDAADIVSGVGMDPRIGNYYNNPSFGYGGYCLPKDTKQLLSNFGNIPQNLIGSIVESNETRKKHIVSQVLRLNPKVVGVYRLIMKAGSDNFRESSILDVMRKVNDEKVEIVIYEPLVSRTDFEGYRIVKDFQHFVKISDVIIANRMTTEIIPYKEKVFSRDIFNNN